jgi:hypothetical protein
MLSAFLPENFSFAFNELLFVNVQKPSRLEKIVHDTIQTFDDVDYGLANKVNQRNFERFYSSFSKF